MECCITCPKGSSCFEIQQMAASRWYLLVKFAGMFSKCDWQASLCSIVKDELKDDVLLSEIDGYFWNEVMMHLYQVLLWVALVNNFYSSYISSDNALEQHVHLFNLFAAWPPQQPLLGSTHYWLLILQIVGGVERRQRNSPQYSS